MIITISIELNAEDPQFGEQLAAMMAAAQALGISGDLSAGNDEQAENTHAPARTLKPAATTPAKKKRMGRPPKPIGHMEDWDRFDQLVRQEMQRLRAGDRMPSTTTWNNERDVRLPTMVGILEAYEAADALHLSIILGLRPPLVALGVQGVRHE